MTDPAPTPPPDDSSDIVTPAPSSGVGPAPSSGVSPAPSSSGIGSPEPSPPSHGSETPDTAPEPSGTPVGAAPRSGCLGAAAAILIAFLASVAFGAHIFTGWLA